MTDCPGVDCVHAPSTETQLTEDGIGHLVDRFYARVRADDQLGPIFAHAIAENEWPAHLATMRDFWSSIMLTSGRYHGNPVSAHRRIEGITPVLFERWLALFGETIAGSFVGKAKRIATSLQLALFYRPEHDAP